jgi:hypothetical protein
MQTAKNTADQAFLHYQGWMCLRNIKFTFPENIVNFDVIQTTASGDEDQVFVDAINKLQEVGLKIPEPLARIAVRKIDISTKPDQLASGRLAPLLAELRQRQGDQGLCDKDPKKPEEVQEMFSKWNDDFQSDGTQLLAYLSFLATALASHNACDRFYNSLHG